MFFYSCVAQERFELRFKCCCKHERKTRPVQVNEQVLMSREMFSFSSVDFLVWYFSVLLFILFFSPSLYSFVILSLFFLVKLPTSTLKEKRDLLTEFVLCFKNWVFFLRDGENNSKEKYKKTRKVQLTQKRNNQLTM
jgi:hypothetical protein